MEVVTEILFTLPANCATPNLTARAPRIEETYKTILTHGKWWFSAGQTNSLINK